MVGDWEIHEKLGEGGMGIVYRASHVLISGDFALKMLRPELARDSSVVNRFLSEVRKARLLDHPNIVRMELPFKTGDSIYLPMEFLHGENLGDLIAQDPEPWPVDRTLEIIYQAAAGLGHAHSRNVLHRDIKPENVFITSTGRVKLLDFGLAKKLGDQSLTAEGMAVGTPVYMAPEILQGKKPIASSDIYALGMIMFRMLTGRLPIPIQDTAATVAEIFGPVLHAHDEGLPRPSSIRPGLPEWLDTLSAQLLDKNPENRPANGAELAHFLEVHRVRSDGSISQDLPLLPTRPVSGETPAFTPPFNSAHSPAHSHAGTPLPPIHNKPAKSTSTYIFVAAVVLLSAGVTWGIMSQINDRAATAKATTQTNKAVRINFSSQPSGAEVFVAGARVCASTPCGAMIPPGTHQVIIRKPKYEGYNHQHKLVTDGTGIHTQLHSKFGFIAVNSRPSGVRVFLDGKTWGSTPINARELKTGTHIIEIRDPQFRHARKKIKLAPGENRNIQLRPVPINAKRTDPKYDDFFELDVPTKAPTARRGPSFDLEP